MIRKFIVVLGGEEGMNNTQEKWRKNCEEYEDVFHAILFTLHPVESLVRLKERARATIIGLRRKTLIGLVFRTKILSFRTLILTRQRISSILPISHIHFFQLKIHIGVRFSQ